MRTTPQGPGHPSIKSTFLSALDAYDLPTAEHSSRVGSLAAALGRKIDLDDTQVEDLGLGGLLHDVGKTLLAPEILFKAGPLNMEEWDEIKRHPILGSEMLLDALPEHQAVAEAIITHHERPDGLGYPFGLRGDQIPLAGRIIAIADVYDAATNPRIYRSGQFTAKDAQSYLHDNRGRQFDGDLVEVFIDMLSSLDASHQ